VTPTQRDEIEGQLRSLPQVDKIYYESKQEAFDRFKEQFKDSALADNVTVDQMPESFRVKLVDPEQFDIVASLFDGHPGVEQVQDQKALLDRIFKVLNGFQLAAIGVALAQIIAAALLISNTIRLAAFSRRRETGIMRLVGASNFYIQLPFLLEGAIAGFIGAVIASAALFALHKFYVLGVLAPNLPITQFVGYGAVWATVPILIVTGVALAALASFVTLRKYLRV
jgi:cell division transport system permease protein